MDMVNHQKAGVGIGELALTEARHGGRRYKELKTN
jgi:hypothetical protein